MRPSLNPEQSAALQAIEDFLSGGEQFFLLSGSAGTGKTFCIQHLVDRVKGRLIFTAPTNKATKVLRDTITTDSYKPECRTIFSLLGLRLEANGEVKELAVPEDPVDLSQYRAIIVDEGSMVSSKLFSFILRVAKAQRVKFIFMGDPAQLPPVGEPRSPIWDACQSRAHLDRVMRFDNQILALATDLRSRVDHPAPAFKAATDNADGEGVWRLGEGEFESRMLEAVDRGEFGKPNGAKAIAWRNITVEALNRRIRTRLFESAAGSPWLPDDRVIALAPAKDLSDEVVATTDDEGTVTRVEAEWHPVWGEFKVWRLSVTLDDNRPVVFRTLHADSQSLFDERVAQMAEAARLDRRKWGQFWEFKETFHSLRHAYAITAHRAQGSTYDTAFVDWRDILLNRSRGEAFRCLYVACSRPKKRLFLN